MTKPVRCLLMLLSLVVTVHPSPPVLRGRGDGGEGVEPPVARPLTPGPSPLSTGERGERLRFFNDPLQG